MLNSEGSSHDRQSATPQLTVVSGLSGSGKSVALRTLEDLDYYCVDNLPAELLPALRGERIARQRRRAAHANSRSASTCATSTTDLSRIGDWLSQVGALGFDHRLVFFDTERRRC